MRRAVARRGNDSRVRKPECHIRRPSLRPAARLQIGRSLRLLPRCGGNHVHIGEYSLRLPRERLSSIASSLCQICALDAARPRLEVLTTEVSVAQHHLQTGLAAQLPLLHEAQKIRGLRE